MFIEWGKLFQKSIKKIKITKAFSEALLNSDGLVKAIMHQFIEQLLMPTASRSLK